MIVTLWYSSTGKGQYNLQLIRYSTLTARYDNPDEVHEEEVKPEVVCFRSAVCQVLVIVVEHARSVVENVAVYLTQGDHSLEGEAHRMLSCDEVCGKVGQRTPADLKCVYQLGSGRMFRGIVCAWEGPTAVTVSIHRTNGSEVRYLESELAYSFHICPKMSVAGAMRV